MKWNDIWRNQLHLKVTSPLSLCNILGQSSQGAHNIELCTSSLVCLQQIFHRGVWNSEGVTPCRLLYKSLRKNLQDYF